MKTLNSRSVFGVLFLLVLVFLLFWMVQENRKNRGQAEILVAAQDIPAGSFISPSMVAISRCPISMVHPENINDLRELDGLTTLFAIPKGRQITYNQFSPSDKAKALSKSHNPHNYTLAVDEATGTGQLFKPGANFFGKVSGKFQDMPLMVFQRVKLDYISHQPLKPLGQGNISTRLFTITPAQVKTLKNLEGQPLKLLLTGASGDEVVDISSLNKTAKEP
jgi:hypothetical protein